MWLGRPYIGRGATEKGENDMHTVICAFDDLQSARQAVDSLVRGGFDRQDIHLQQREMTAEGEEGARGGLPGKEGDDRGVLSSFGHFFASILGRDNPSGQVDTYTDHVQRGGCVVVVDADDEAGARRARTLLQELRGGDVDVVERRDQGRLRDIAGRRNDSAGMMERSSESYDSWSGSESIARERAMASHRLDAIGGPALRDPDTQHAPGLRYADKDKPNG